MVPQQSPQEPVYSGQTIDHQRTGRGEDPKTFDQPLFRKLYKIAVTPPVRTVAKVLTEIVRGICDHQVLASIRDKGEQFQAVPVIDGVYQHYFMLSSSPYFHALQRQIADFGIGLPVLQSRFCRKNSFSCLSAAERNVHKPYLLELAGRPGESQIDSTRRGFFDFPEAWHATS